MDNSKYDVLKLENQLCFPIYATSREIVKKYKPYLEKIDLTYTQYIVMMVLWERKTVNVKELGECLYLDSGTLTPLLKKLESKGFVSRMRSETDERNLVVSIKTLYPPSPVFMMISGSLSRLNIERKT